MASERVTLTVADSDGEREVALSSPNRVRLLMQDYDHFALDPKLLNTQLDCLLSLHGAEKIARWQAMANDGQMPALVSELLSDHYDPAYLRSIERNFTRFSEAATLTLKDIGAADFLAAAHSLHH